MRTLDTVIRSFLRTVRNRLISPVQIPTINCYSQAGEDRILAFLFQSMGITRPKYIDIGAYKAAFCNNTYLFYLQGSRGVCIEPDPRLFDALKATRTEDICLNAAVGLNHESEVELYLFDEPSLNTLSLEEAKRRDAVGEYKLIGSRKVPAVRIEDVIGAHFTELPSFISLDVEGVDYDILAGFDFDTYKVPIWIVESVEYSPSHVKARVNGLVELMETKGYFVYGYTYINTIFVHRAWFERHGSAV
jgi:FkbM family methyltransferase